MVLDKEVQIKVNNRTAQIYKDKGYDIPMTIGVHGNIIFDTTKYFTIKVEDLESTSTVKVHTSCDFCGNRKTMSYRDYCRKLDDNGLKTCVKCKTAKYKITCLEKYGVEYAPQSDFIKEKTKKTNQKRYGVDWCMGNKDIQEKRRETYISKYGCEWATQNEQVKEKTKNTNIKRYGVESPTMTPEVKRKMKNTMLERYGSETVMHIPEFREKISKTNLERYGSKYTFGSKEIYDKGIDTKYKNGTVATSIQQKYICDLYSGILNYPCSNYNLDIVVDDINIEYDGGGHELSVELNKISKHDFDVKQIIRDKIVKSNGYKIIRFISKSDKLPSDNILLHILDLSKTYFNTTNHTWIEWYFDDNKIRNADNKNGEFFDFGALRKIKRKSALITQ